jgi:hypothetical protein
MAGRESLPVPSISTCQSSRQGRTGDGVQPGRSLPLFRGIGKRARRSVADPTAWMRAFFVLCKLFLRIHTSIITCLLSVLQYDPLTLFSVKLLVK